MEDEAEEVADLESHTTASIMLRSATSTNLGRMANATLKQQTKSFSTLSRIASKPSLPAVQVGKSRIATQTCFIRHNSTSTPAEFDPHAQTAMDKQTPPAPGDDFNVVIVGA